MTMMFVLLMAGFLLGILTISALRSGHVLSAPAFVDISREQRPLLYWLIIALQITGAVAFIGLAATSL
ncbi:MULTISPECIES: hypothetical protein [Stenotrophomonas]|uniref:hypothetical protein n=1 Tax=Stenotrophomonas TaxID=40323 RepID=UPI0011803DBC|nr:MULTISPECIES: hypothetical protein [Stenotrophomonas]MDQ7282714.1 hypothetical protein [Stenotrophomonas sp. Sm6012]